MIRQVALADLPIRELVPVKVTLSWRGTQDHRRWVFRSKAGNGGAALFYKIWNESYVRRDNLPAAIDAGFIDESIAPALDGIIVQDGICRGYVMKACERGPGLLDEGFRELVYARTRSTRHFFVQFGADHVMRWGSKRSLIDLEGIYPLSALPQLGELNCRFDDARYAGFVADLYRDAFPGSQEPDAARGCAGAARPRPGVPVRVLRRIRHRLRLRRPRLDLIQP